MFRRIWSLVAALTLLVSVVASGNPAAAQDSGHTFTLHFGTCSWMSSTRDIVFASTMGSADSAFDCVAGPWPAELVTFTLDGVLADSNDGATATWTNVSNGLHSLDTHPQAPIQLHQDVTIDGDVDLWATLYFANTETRPDLTPTPSSTQEPTGYTLTLDVWTCSVTGGLPSMSIAEVANESGVGRNCVEGAAGIASIRMNGATGTVSGTSVTWNGAPSDIEITAPVAAVDGGSRTLTGDTTLVATFFISDLTPTPGTPGQVNIRIDQCNTATGAQSWIGIGAPEGFSDCFAVKVTDKEWGLRIDGARPTSYSGNVATWSGLANGTHVATTNSGARYEFSIQDNELFLSAIFGPDGAVSGAVGGGQAPAATVTPLPSLPNTGAGSEGSGGSPMAVMVALAALVALTLAAAGEAIRRGDRA